jgi:hypothetical protein
MARVEDLPLEEAVAKGLIPCASCGAKSAAVKRVEGKPHFLCATCSGGRRTTWLGVLLGLGLVAAAAAWLAPRGPEAPPQTGDVDRFLREGKTREAVRALEAQAQAAPGDPRPLFLLGRLRLDLGYTEGALAAFVRVIELEPDAALTAGLFVGVCLQRLGRAGEALPQLQATVGDPALDALRKASLAECLLDLERYDEALALLGDGKDPRRLWARHRALSYGGRPAEARALLKDVDPREAWTFEASRLREDGDFEGARRLLDARRKAAPDDRLKLARSELLLAADEGDLTRLLERAGELAAASDVQLRAQGLGYRATACLLAGNRDGARAAAEAFFATADPELSSIRLERLQMRYLLGQATVADIEAEAKRVSRAHANDLYWFLAAATEDRAWAEKGLAATPGRNFPYHALKRLAGK